MSAKTSQDWYEIVAWLYGGDGVEAATGSPATGTPATGTPAAAAHSIAA